MALQWQWSEKCGEAIFHNLVADTTFSVNLYEGNAFLIFIDEFKENDENMWRMYSFFVDEAHAKNCLGLTKENSNIFDTGTVRLEKIRINKKVYGKTSKLVNLLVKAFDAIEIEIYSEAVT